MVEKKWVQLWKVENVLSNLVFTSIFTDKHHSLLASIFSPYCNCFSSGLIFVFLQVLPFTVTCTHRPWPKYCTDWRNEWMLDALQMNNQLAQLSKHDFPCLLQSEMHFAESKSISRWQSQVSLSSDMISPTQWLHNAKSNQS